jgi:hypothetical protein
VIERIYIQKVVVFSFSSPLTFHYCFGFFVVIKVNENILLLFLQRCAKVNIATTKIINNELLTSLVYFRKKTVLKKNI